jgi:hypothetical protein
MELEWAGRPSVTIVTDALVGAAEQMKRISRMPEYPYVVTPFPVGNLSRDELRKRAPGLIDEVLRLLHARQGGGKTAAKPGGEAK